MAARSRLPLIAGLSAATFGGYYMYTAGGSPKVAEKQVERDAARLSSSVKGHLPGSAKEFKTEAKVLGEQFGQKIDDTVKEARNKTREFDAKFEAYRADAEKNIDQYRKEAGKEVHNAIDTFDKKVGDGVARIVGTVDAKAEQAKATAQAEANKAKGGWFGWFK